MNFRDYCLSLRLLQWLWFDVDLIVGVVPQCEGDILLLLRLAFFLAHFHQVNDFRIEVNFGSSYVLESTEQAIFFLHVLLRGRGLVGAFLDLWLHRVKLEKDPGELFYVRVSVAG